MKLIYRPEIDGLRAIAVVAVILYHSKSKILGHYTFQGGFIGVDIFFVISGYLITSIILKELVTTGSFSFKYFYERRIRRILPALLVVMLASLPFAWIYLLPSSFIDFSKSILYSLGFSSNFYFWYSGLEYGAEIGLLKPFLHTWSLSVEEQYYVLVPIFLLITFKYFRKYLIYILILGFILSLALADWGSRNYPSFNFYVLPTRGWELIAGSILAYFEITLGHRSKNRALNLILPSFGLFLIGHSFLFFNDKMFHPSFYTLSPIIGVCLIIWFSNKDEVITKILSSKLFVGIGLISYSLYLWHYPIFAFARIKDNTPSEYDKFEWVVLTIILSILSYYFVERPARNKKSKFKIIFFIIITSISALVIFNSSSIIKEGYGNRYVKIFRESLSPIKEWHLLLNQNSERCMNNNEPCIFNGQRNKKIILYGDSHAGSLSFDLKKRLDNTNYQFITMYKECFNFKDIDFVNKFTKKISPYCNKKNFEKNNIFLKDIKNSTFVIVGRFPVYLSNLYYHSLEGGTATGDKEPIKTDYPLEKNKIINSTKEFIFDLIKNNNKVIIIYPIPEIEFNVPEEIKKIYLKNQKFFSKKINLTTSFEAYKKRTSASFKLFDSLINENIYRVYPHTVFCNLTSKDRCATHNDKNMFYVDNNHPSLTGGEMINSLIMKEIKKIELKSN